MLSDVCWIINSLNNHAWIIILMKHIIMIHKIFNWFKVHLLFIGLFNLSSKIATICNINNQYSNKLSLIWNIIIKPKQFYLHTREYKTYLSPKHYIYIRNIHSLQLVDPLVLMIPSPRPLLLKSKSIFTNKKQKIITYTSPNVPYVCMPFRTYV